MKKARRFLAVFLMLALLSGFGAVASADAISVSIDGEPVIFEDQGPVIVDRRTLVPIRGVFEALGFEVDWDREAQAAVLTGDYYEIIVPVGSDIFTVNGEEFELDVPAQLIGGRTMLPIRAVLESVGYYVDWDSATGTVLISSEPFQEPVMRTLPSLHVAIDMRDIDRYSWTRGISVSLRGAGEYDFEDADTRIRGRGNSTWRAMGAKRPFRLRFEEDRPMFGTEYAARDWVLLANAIDYSLMRNNTALTLGSKLGRFQFSPITGNFVHVYLNGVYWGVYQITDQLEAHPDRVAVTFNEDPALSEYYLEWCLHRREDEEVWFQVRPGIFFDVRYPEPEDMSDAHLIFVRNFMRDVDRAIRRQNFEEVSALIDIDTFVDFYLVNEFTKNADVFFSSVHMTVRLEEGGHRLHAGPLWDFDQSAGGTFDSFYPDYSPQGAWAAYRNYWFRDLMLIPEFRAIVAERWFEIRDAEVAETLELIRYMTVAYRAEFERNFERWDTIGRYLWRTPPSMQGMYTYAEQVAYLLDWFEQRLVWMDEFLGG